MAETDPVGVLPDMVQVQAVQREEASVGAVEFLNPVGQFQVVFFLETRVEVGFENGLLGRNAESLDQACVVQFMEDFLADGFQGRKVGVEQDDAKTATVRKETKDIDKAQVGKHGQDADTPGVFDGLVGTAPSEEVVLVGVHLYIEKRLAGPVGPHEFLVQTGAEQLCRIDNVLELLFVEDRANGRINGFLFHVAKYSYL